MRDKKVGNFLRNQLKILVLTYWGRVTHICVANPTVIGSDNGLSPSQRQAIIWSNAGILSIEPQRTHVSEILIGTHTFLLKNACQKAVCKMVAILSRPQCVKQFLLNHSLKLCSYHGKGCFNSLWPNDGIWRQRSGSTLAQVMACCLTVPSHYLNVLIYHQWGPLAFIWVQFYFIHQSLKLAEKLLPYISLKSPRGQWVKQVICELHLQLPVDMYLQYCYLKLQAMCWHVYVVSEQI